MDKKVVIFDFDGTIANTLDAAVEIYNKIAPRYRCKPIELETNVKNILRNKRPQEFLKEYRISFFKLPFLKFRLQKELHKHISDIPIIKGMENVIKEIYNLGVSLGVLTSNSEKNVKKFLSAHNLFDLFEFIKSGRNIFGKDKDILWIMKKYNLSKNNVVYIGDETRDVEAAKKVGIEIISVCWGFNYKEILQTLNPNFIVESPEEILPCIRKILKV